MAGENPQVRRVTDPVEVEELIVRFDEFAPDLCVWSIWMDYTLHQYKVYALELNGHTVGLALVLETPEEHNLYGYEPVQELSRMIIDPAHRRQGLGRFFVGKLVEHHPAMILTSTDDARAFWSKLSEVRFLADIVSFWVFATPEAYERVHGHVQAFLRGGRAS